MPRQDEYKPDAPAIERRSKGAGADLLEDRDARVHLLALRDRDQSEDQSGRTNRGQSILSVTNRPANRGQSGTGRTNREDQSGTEHAAC